MAKAAGSEQISFSNMNNELMLRISPSQSFHPAQTESEDDEDIDEQLVQEILQLKPMKASDMPKNSDHSNRVSSYATKVDENSLQASSKYQHVVQ